VIQGSYLRIRRKRPGQHRHGQKSHTLAVHSFDSPVLECALRIISATRQLQFWDGSRVGNHDM
ncbi:MAG TPA: hypothetical protein VK437_10895, partial [Steroidobacteraceae bacterium]|nr:hypothetical protein [Steroidobacteraceae bacterium]